MMLDTFVRRIRARLTYAKAPRNNAETVLEGRGPTGYYTFSPMQTKNHSKSARCTFQGLRVHPPTVSTLRQFCRVRRYLTGETMDQTINQWATAALAAELARDPSLAVIAAGKGSKRKAGVDKKPPANKPRSSCDWGCG